MADFTNIQLAVLKAAADGDASNADVGSRRVRTRTINALKADGYLYSRNIDYRVELTPKGETALGERVSA